MFVKPPVMPSFSITDQNTRKVILICVGTGILCLSLGVIIGYFPGHKGNGATTGSQSASLLGTASGACDFSKYTDIGRKYTGRYVQKALDNECLHSGDTCNTYQLPRTYNAYHLNGQTIQIDGHLTDAAWQQVPWSQSFQDIRSSVYPNPRYETKVKVRWDDSYLYIAGYVQEHDVTGFVQTAGGKVWQDNDFEVLLNVDGTTHFYKQVVTNALGTTTDLMFGPGADGPTTMYSDWSAGMQKAVLVNGTINVAGDTDNFWTVEWALQLTQLAMHTERSSPRPQNNEVWFANFGRAEYNYKVLPGNTYAKAAGDDGDWWSWQPCGAINLHIPNRWGLIQFKQNLGDTQFSFDKWHMHKALFDVYEALKAYKGINNIYTSQLEELNLPPYLFSRACVDIPEVELDGDSFVVAVQSLMTPGLVGKMKSDRYVSFEHI